MVIIQEEEEEDRAGEEVEDAVPDHLARRRDDVPALGARPRDRVRDQHEREPARTQQVCAPQAWRVGERRAGRVPEEHVPGAVLALASVKVQTERAHQM